MAFFLDKRFVVNGKLSKIDLNNSFNLDKFVKGVVTNEVNTVAAEITDDINTLRNVVVVNDSYNALPTDYRILVDQTELEAPTVNLPSAIGITGKTYFIKAISYTDPVTVTVDGVELIDGNTSVTLTAAYKYVEIVSANNQWYIVNSN